MLEWIRQQWPLAWKSDLSDSKDDLDCAYQEIDRLNEVTQMQLKAINEKNTTIEELRRQVDELIASALTASPPLIEPPMNATDEIRLQDVTGMTEHYQPILNESGGEIKNGHLSGGMRVTVPDPFFGGTIVAVVDDEIFMGQAWARSGSVAYSLVLDPVRAIWVYGNMHHSVQPMNGIVF